MFVIILLAGVISVANSLHVVEKGNSEEAMEGILRKYIQNVSDIDSKYIINEALSKWISHYLKGKVNVLPLYKMSLKIDRNPVKIPWTINEKISKDSKGGKLKYKYVKVQKTEKHQNATNSIYF